MVNDLNESQPDWRKLDKLGLNLQAVLDLKDLPDDLLAQLKQCCNKNEEFNKLLLVGHAGKKLWEKVKYKVSQETHAIDQYSMSHVENFLQDAVGKNNFEMIFPSTHSVGLQKLGELAGWHFASPFRVGINNQWGSWYAYRAAALVKANWTTKIESELGSPCLNCEEKPCIGACAGDALEGEALSLNKCLDYRKLAGSRCVDRCLARMTCPVAHQHRYELEQIQYHYGRSIKFINKD
ncbi:hypothetical protein [Aliikangiella sp. G2MR2-5]|uniref:hypothetical protein n=1 Tax=Aliikangiella sp. G2MR2-5 TaxID=2788943 RepID=UPI0018A94158|nr:hypothetical protein [Aliikangiella sp. G2MR2-5]